jgi:hypothetical protein
VDWDSIVYETELTESSSEWEQDSYSENEVASKKVHNGKGKASAALDLRVVTPVVSRISSKLFRLPMKVLRRDQDAYMDAEEANVAKAAVRVQKQHETDPSSIKWGMCIGNANGRKYFESVVLDGVLYYVCMLLFLIVSQFDNAFANYSDW